MDNSLLSLFQSLKVITGIFYKKENEKGGWGQSLQKAFGTTPFQFYISISYKRVTLQQALIYPLAKNLLAN